MFFICLRNQDEKSIKFNRTRVRLESQKCHRKTQRGLSCQTSKLICSKSLFCSSPYHQTLTPFVGCQNDPNHLGWAMFFSSYEEWAQKNSQKTIIINRREKRKTIKGTMKSCKSHQIRKRKKIPFLSIFHRKLALIGCHLIEICLLRDISTICKFLECKNQQFVIDLNSFFSSLIQFWDGYSKVIMELEWSGVSVF